MDYFEAGKAVEITEKPEAGRMVEAWMDALVIRDGSNLLVEMSPSVLRALSADLPTHPLTGDAGMSKMDAWPILSPMTSESAPDDGASLSAGLGRDNRNFFEPDPVKVAEYLRKQARVLP